MADYSLPDGKTLTVPDDASKEYLDTLQNRLVELYPETYKPFTEPPDNTKVSYFSNILLIIVFFFKIIIILKLF